MQAGKNVSAQARQVGACALTYVVLCLAAALAGCGGGGGGDGSSSGGSTGSYSVTPASLSFTSAQGTAPSSKTLVASSNGGTVYFATSFSGTAVGTVSAGSCTGSSCSFFVSPPALSTPGTYTGTVTIKGCSDSFCLLQVLGSPKTINVTYTVTAAPAITAAPTSVIFSAEAGSAPTAQNIALSFNSGSAPWTTSIAYTSGTSGWLSAPTSGSGFPANIALSASAMPAGVYGANLTITTGGVTSFVPVTLTVSPKQVTFVAPYVAKASAAGTVIVRGHGFSSLVGPIVRFGATQATSVTYVSNTEIRATHPALSAGSYAVTVGDGSQTLTTRANLLVTAAPSYSYKRTARPSGASEVSSLIYDDERQAIYAFDRPNHRIERYRYNAGTQSWGLDTKSASSSGPQNHSLALAPDGSELLYTDGGFLVRLNPSSFASLGTVNISSIVGTPAYTSHMVFMNDGGAIGHTSGSGSATAYRYDLLTDHLAVLSAPTMFIQYALTAPADGSMVLASTPPNNERPFQRYWGGSGFAATNYVDGTYEVSVNRTGTRMIFTKAIGSTLGTGTVLDSDLNVLGTLPTHSAAAISPNGSRAYLWVSATNTLRTFDLNSPNGSSFTEVGSGTVPIDLLGTVTKILVTSDGGNLVLAGANHMVVMPAP